MAVGVGEHLKIAAEPQRQGLGSWSAPPSPPNWAYHPPPCLPAQMSLIVRAAGIWSIKAIKENNSNGLKMMGLERRLPFDSLFDLEASGPRPNTRIHTPNKKQTNKAGAQQGGACL